MNFFKQLNFVVVLAFIQHVTAYAQETSIVTDFSLTQRRVAVRLIPDSTDYKIAERDSILPGISVSVNGIVFSEEVDFSFDYAHRELKLHTPLPDSALAEIEYRILPRLKPVSVRFWDAPLEWSEVIRYDSSEGEQGDVPTQKVESSFGAERLRTTGSLVRGVRIGTNEGLMLDSGLRLQLDGEVADGVTLAASMTDLNTPIQPEGNTQTLKEIDKIFVELTGKNASLRLGDVDVDYAGSGFADYHRRVKGGKFSLSQAGSELSFAGAVSQAKFRSISIIGIEGNQGPYLLSGDNPARDVFVIAGSERVYIDGKRMARGETADYVIDYSNAELTFTPYRGITSDSRIVVDYEYSDRSYNRSILAAGVSSALADRRIVLNGRFFRESDDGSNPIGFDHSDDELAALAASGDENAYIDGGRFVGAGKGAYIKVYNAAAADSVYIYVGQDPDGSFIGDWSVSFSRVGTGMGDYDNRSGDSLFVNTSGNSYIDYVGKGAGSFTARKLLLAPSTHSLADLAVDANPTERLKIKAEVAVSDFDQNTISAKADEGNTGTALSLIGRYGAADYGQSSGLNLDIGVRRLARNFNRIDRIDEIEYDRKWNLPDSIAAAEMTMEAGAAYEFGGGQNIFVRGGELSLENIWSSQRLELGGGKELPVLGRVSYRLEDISSSAPDTALSSDWLRQRGDWKLALGKFAPRAGFESEKKENSDTLRSGFEFIEYYTGTDLNKGGSVSAFFEQRRRSDSEMVSGTFSPRSDAVTNSLGFELSSRRSLSAKILLSARNRRYKGEFSKRLPDVKSNLADIHASYRPTGGSIRLEADYRAASERLAVRERIYLRVKEGAGNWRYEDEIGEYVPDDAGDFVLRTENTELYKPVIDLATAVRITIKPPRRSRRDRDTGFWRSLSSRTSVRLDEKTKEVDINSIYFLDFSKFRRDETTVFGRLNVDQDLTLFRRRNGSNLRLHYRYVEEKNNRFISGGEERLQRVGEMRWRRTVSEKTRLDMEARRIFTVRNFQSVIRRDRDVAADEVSVDVSHLPSRKMEIGLVTMFRKDEDRKHSEGLESRLLDVEVRNTFFMKTKGQLRLSFGWAHVSVSPKGIPITYEMANGFKEGDTFRWTLGFDYRLSGNLNATISYEGIDEPFRDTRHLGRAEVRAWF